MDNAYKLKKEYSASGVPTFIADENMKILWKNSIESCIIGKAPIELEKSAEVLFGSGGFKTGLMSRAVDGEIFTFNVIKRSEEEKSYYIIELIASRSPGGIVSAEAVREYIGYICSKIRGAARDIISVTDRLFDDISEGGFNKSRAAEDFDRIYESVMTLDSEAAYPDRIYSLIDPKKSDDIIILDREMTAVASEIKVSLRDRVRISEDYDRDIFFRMNADSFETAVVSMTADCCGEGNYPERIIFSARRFGAGRAEITVMSLNTARGSDSRGSGAIGGSSRVCETERSFNKRLISEYIHDVLGLKNGARFSKESIPGGLVCRMNIEAMPRGSSVFAEKPVDGFGRHDKIADKLAFFFGDGLAALGRRYTSRGEKDGEPEWVHNIYREDIENEKSEV